MDDPLRDFLDRPVEDTTYHHPILALGADCWLVLGEGMKRLMSEGLPAARVWTLDEIRSLPWPEPPTLRMVLRRFGDDRTFTAPSTVS